MSHASVAVQHKGLEGLDIAVIIVYFLIIFAIGVYFARKEKTSEDYFLAGRNVGWFADRSIVICFQHLY